MNFFLSRGIVCRIEKYQIFGRKNRNIAQRESLQERKIPKKWKEKSQDFFLLRGIVCRRKKYQKFGRKSQEKDILLRGKVCRREKYNKIGRRSHQRKNIAQRDCLQEIKIQ